MSLFPLCVSEDERVFPAECWIHRLPLELLARIFDSLLAQNLDPYGFPSPGQCTVPILLTWICSSWRHLAISTPSLWASISLGSQGSNPFLDATILDVFISRAGDELPFSFALNYDLPDSSRPHRLALDKPQVQSYLDGIRSITRLLIPIRHRWRHAIVNVLVSFALDPFFQALSWGTPMLEYLSVSSKFTGFSGPEYTLDLNSCAGILHTVRIQTPMVRFDPSAPLLEHLTTLDLQFVYSLLDTLDWLRCCPNLEELTLEIYGSPNTINPQNTKPIRIPRLSRFSVTCVYAETADASPLLDVLITPSLRSLSFRKWGLSLLGPDRSSLSIINLIERSESPPLEELRLSGTLENSNELLQVLQRASKVTHLTLEGEAVTDDLLLHFHEWPVSADWPGGPRDTDPLCPKLQYLELVSVPVSFPGIIALALSRTTGQQSVGSSEYRTLKTLVLSSDKYSQYAQEESVVARFPRELTVLMK